MKTTLWKITFILFVTILSSCSKQISKSIESYSADKEMKISIQGKRTSPLDPWILDIEMSYKGETSKVHQEFYADEINKQTIHFEWKSNRKCMIQLTQRDGVLINVPIQIH